MAAFLTINISFTYGSKENVSGHCCVWLRKQIKNQLEILRKNIVIIISRRCVGPGSLVVLRHPRKVYLVFGITYLVNILCRTQEGRSQEVSTQRSHPPWSHCWEVSLTSGEQSSSSSSFKMPPLAAELHQMLAPPRPQSLRGNSIRWQWSLVIVMVWQRHSM